MDGNALIIEQDPPGKLDFRRFILQSAKNLLVGGLLAMVLIPLIEAVGRRFAGIGIPGAAGWVQHLTLWLGLGGAVVAAARGRHLAIATTEILKLERLEPILTFLKAAGTLSILTFLTWGSWVLVESQMGSPEALGGWFPVWIAQLALPGAFLGMAYGTVIRDADSWPVRIALLGVAGIICLLFIFVPEAARPFATNAGILLIVALALIGMPLYIVLGGVALLLFYSIEVPIAAIPAETYRIVTQPVLPSIPLFVLAGTVLAAGKGPLKLVNLVQAWTSWLPGGSAISTIVACAIFTAITGASGVTILALGALMFPILIAANNQPRFSLGLLTASGSVGLLFPPSLPVILYGVYAHVPIDRLFLAALLPGILLVLTLSLFSAYRGRNPGQEKTPFKLRQALSATWAAKGYLVLPVVVIFGLFGGILTLVETAALTALWAILLESVFSNNLKLGRDLPKVMLDSTVLVGALLIIMGMALGVVSYLVDAEIPQRAAEWVQSTIQSRIVFLLALNGMLLLVGALMDIFSAIVIFVPLIAPMGLAFGIDPIHLGIIFLANLELGYLTPPIGMNLFISSLTFKRPLVEIWRTVMPFVIIFIAWVLLITYAPVLTVGWWDF